MQTTEKQANNDVILKVSNLTTHFFIREGTSIA